MEAQKMDTMAAMKWIKDRYGWDEQRSAQAVAIALDHGLNNEPIPEGILSIQVSRVRGRTSVTIEENLVRKVTGNVARTPADQYTSREAKHKPPIKEEPIMARQAATAPATENGTPDLTVYKDKPPTATMALFADWIVKEVGVEFGTNKEMDAFKNGVRLGGTLRMIFQASDTNKQARATRRAETAAAASAPKETATDTPKPTRGRKPKETPAEPTPATTGRRRGRPAAATAAAPY